MNSEPAERSLTRTVTLFKIMLVDIAALAVFVGQLFLANGWQPIGWAFVATVLWCLGGGALWQRKSALARPFTVVASILAVPLCFLVAMAALAPMFESEGPELTAMQDAAYRIGFIVGGLNTAFVAAMFVSLLSFDMVRWRASGTSLRPLPPAGHVLVWSTFLAGALQFGVFAWQLAVELHPCTMGMVVACALPALFELLALKWWIDGDPRGAKFARLCPPLQLVGALVGALLLASGGILHRSPAWEPLLYAILATNIVLPLFSLFAAEYFEDWTVSE